MPRSLLKNGKRSKNCLDSSRQSELAFLGANSQQEPNTMAPSVSSAPSISLPQPIAPPSESICYSAIMKDINLLRNDVDNLIREFAHLSLQKRSPISLDTCHIKVYFPSPGTPVTDSANCSNLLGCPVLQVTRISSKSIKVKIPKPCLHSALQSSDSTSHLVYVWKNHVPRSATATSSTSSSLRQTDTIQIATWNCRRLHNSIPYIKHLISKGTDILVLQEHWL